MKDILETLQTLQDTPVPNLLVIVGFLFLFLAFVGKFGAIVELPKERQKWAGFIGSLLLISGIGLFILPVSQPDPAPTEIAVITPDTPTDTPIPPTNTPAPSTDTPTDTPIPPTNTPVISIDTPLIEPSNVWTKHPSNPVLDVDAQGSWDENWVLFPSVIKDGNTYMMWYRGVDASGLRHIGLATSTDGVNWTKCPTNPIVAPGNPGEWDESQIESARIIKDGDTYKMWYTGADVSSTKRIGYATSSDGINWIKCSGNPVLDVSGTNDWDGAGVSGANIIKDGTIYKMWYAGTDRYDVTQLGYATSPDGIIWTKHANNPILARGIPGTWDSYWVTYPSVLKEGDTYQMWYFGKSDQGVDRIGYATSSDGISWNKSLDNPVLNIGAESKWDDFGVAAPSVILDDSTYKMWFQGWQGVTSSIRIGYATSPTQ